MSAPCAIPPVAANDQAVAAVRSWRGPLFRTTTRPSGPYSGNWANRRPGRSTPPSAPPPSSKLGEPPPGAFDSSERAALLEVVDSEQPPLRPAIGANDMRTALKARLAELDAWRDTVISVDTPAA
ncbi:hypothetical protein [Streptosporangium sp. 'caverna']|uniref:hypothetical protein n=1 Tax=Streptosporangium sp. 'caverna' TaxID=2202249 RepID=UPI000D7D7C71|nr:hypothetical protein [Streptosporangium sp. 'caverna']AWS43300.1 hypothetical protein DKM19_19875 [Streptosporangium sp. 'caverna']